MSSSYTNAEQSMRPPLGGGRRRPRRQSAAATAATVERDEADGSIASAPPQVTYEQEKDAAAADHHRHSNQQKQYKRSSRHSHKSDAAASATTTTAPHPSSFQDQLAASAVAGTIEFLKVAGGLTLNATGKVVAPPLHVTKTYLLPALWAAFMDYLSTSTPKRAKDWFRILSTSVHNLIIALRETEKGQLFRQRLVLWGADLIDCLSADTTRQVLVDGMATWIKFIQALHTPECRECFNQITVLSCRVTQVLASGRSQQAMHDFKTVLWSGVELLADPSSTTAFAQVTAYLCHALEMEDAILDGAFHETTSRHERTDRRKERDEYQTETFQGKTTLVNNPDATVEQVILSSLGGCSSSSTDVPGAVASSHDMLDSPETLYTDHNIPPNETSANSVVFHSEAGSIRQQVEEVSTQTGEEDDDDEEDEEEWPDQAQSNVNVQMLKREIFKRAERLERNNDIPRNIPAVTTPNATAIPPNSNRVFDQEAPEGEGSLERFYRVLDNVMKEKRVEGIDHILADYAADSTAKSYLREGKVHKPLAPKDTDLLAESIRSRLAHIRADINKELDSNDREKLKSMEATLKRNSWVVYAGIAFVLGFILLWFALGCYGIYMLVYPSLAGPVKEILTSHHHPVIPPTSRPVQYENEIVIRLVREVVHTDGTGFVLERRPEQSQLSRDRLEKISECISESVDSQSD